MLALEWYLVGGVVCAIGMVGLYYLGILFNKVVDFILEVFQ